MNLVNAAHEVLAGQIPLRVNQGGKGNLGGSAYFHDVPTSALPPGCEVTRTPDGFSLKGAIKDCQFTGHATPAENQTEFRRVLICFAVEPTNESLH